MNEIPKTIQVLFTREVDLHFFFESDLGEGSRFEENILPLPDFVATREPGTDGVIKLTFKEGSGK